MKAHLITKHLVVPRSRSFAKVKVNYQGHSFQNTAIFGGINVSETQLAHQYLFNPFPNNPWFLRVCSRSLLKTL